MDVSYASTRTKITLGTGRRAHGYGGVWGSIKIS